MGPGALQSVLCELPQRQHPDLLVGIETSDDAGVYRLRDDLALIQTLDFFTPIVDDPYIFGQIAAANSLSDVYAMGGTPLTAMNIVAFPLGQLPATVLGEILQGGADKIREAGAVLVGGHTIEDQEPKYGLSVTGTCHPAAIWANRGAQPGDVLVLTKAIGTGVLATAAKAELFPQGVEAATASMRILNRRAMEAGRSFAIHACTDVTGFGLLGHLSEMTSASGVQAEIEYSAVPLLPEALEAATMGLIPGGAYRNREHCRKVFFSATVPLAIQDLLFDPQTSGGLLFSLPAAQGAMLVSVLRQEEITAAVVGRILGEGEGEIHVY